MISVGAERHILTFVMMFIVGSLISGLTLRSRRHEQARAREERTEVWGRGHVDQVHYLRVYMAQLRRKIEADPARPRLLATEPGVGYRLRDRG